MSSLTDKIILPEAFLFRNTKVSKEVQDDYLKNRVFQPRRDCEKISIKLPLDWESKDREEDRNWRMQLQGFAMFHPITHYFDSREDKAEIVHYFLEVLTDWDINYGADPFDIVTDRMPKSYAWYDMTTGFRALTLAFFINRIQFFSIDISEKSKNLIQKTTLKHIKHLCHEEVFSLNNHGIFQIQGLMALLKVSGEDSNKETISYALDKMESLVDSQFDNKGVHLEHSPHYHLFALHMFERILMNDWYNKKPGIIDTLKKASEVSKWIVDPHKRPACIGDSILTKQEHVDFSVNDHADDLEVETNDKKFVFSKFNESGYSIFRSNWDCNPEKATYFFFMGMYHSKTHKHRDCLSFEWLENGDKLICDSGKYGYKSNEYRNFFLSNRAHNTVEIEGFDIIKLKKYSSAIQETIYEDGIFKLNSKLDYPAVKFNRNIYLKPGRWIIVNDNLDFQKSKLIKQWFHLNKDYGLESFDQNYFKFSNANNKLIVHCLNGECSPKFSYGDRGSMQGFISEKDWHYTENCALGFSANAKKHNLFTILSLGEDDYMDAISYLEGNELNQGLKLDSKSFVTKNLPMINNIPHKRFYDSNIILNKGKSTFTINEYNKRLDFFCDKKEGSDQYIVVLPGAIDRSKHTYNFQRYSWSDDLKCSLISFMDPTIKEDNALSIGWFVGDTHNHSLKVLIINLKNILRFNNIPEEKVLFLGSSAGGFSSLKLSNNFPKSKILVINPQTNVLHYHKEEINKLFDGAFPGFNQEDIVAQFGDRFSLDINLYRRKAPIFYIQNKSDRHHLKEHLRPFLGTIDNQYHQITDLDKNEELKGEKKLNIILYRDSLAKHSPPPKELNLEWIKTLTGFN